MQKIPSSTPSDGLSIQYIPTSVEKSTNYIFEVLTGALNEIKRLKSELAIQQTKVDTLTHFYDNKRKDPDKWIKGTKELNENVNDANSSKQLLTPTQLAPGLANELDRVKGERDNLKRLYEAAIKEKVEAVKEERGHQPGCSAAWASTLHGRKVSRSAVKLVSHTTSVSDQQHNVTPRLSITNHPNCGHILTGGAVSTSPNLEKHSTPAISEYGAGQGPKQSEHEKDDDGMIQTEDDDNDAMLNGHEKAKLL